MVPTAHPGSHLLGVEGAEGVCSGVGGHGQRVEAPRAGCGLRDLQGEGEGTGAGTGRVKPSPACRAQPASSNLPSRPRSGTTPGLQSSGLGPAPPTGHPAPSLTPSLDGSEPWCRSLSRSRSVVRAARTLLSELCTVGAGRPSDSLPLPLPLPACPQPPPGHALTLLSQGPETALHVGIVWGWQPAGARGVPGLQVAR